MNTPTTEKKPESVKRIDALTEEQKAAMKPWADKWIAAGLRTDEADWATFLNAARDCYRLANLAEPRRIIAVQSPVVCVRAGPIAAYILESENRKANEADRNNITVVSTVAEAVKALTGTDIPATLSPEMKAAIRDNWRAYLGGQFWSAWSAYTSFFREVCHLDLGDDLNARELAYRLAQQSVSWWWPHEQFTVCSNRPAAIHRDAQYRLHHEHEHAIRFRDGWGVYAWHGLRVPNEKAKVITAPETLTVADVDAEQNAELRRIMLDRFPGGGAKAFLSAAGGEVIDRAPVHVPLDPGPEGFAGWWQSVLAKLRLANTPVGFINAELIKRVVPGDEDIVMVKLINSTPEPDGSFKNYMLRVPPVTRTVREAVAWSFELKKDQYAPAVES